ncbi:MAG: hypothetical protein BGO37_08220 [Cellulomonas sp. 73-92]|uniref:DUF2975 domain-containing protein n=1 Tax=Cellulomonas sp. 73-92 TaxID=1895740 RepID=UPI00092A81A5|nr:DUF2975 domain-containing protein [Cellulomonas sp. 73-92]OJV84399.1 MAG: hypothetical protein BGO37_08220 [Cellulomonas sp. 73-92]
MISTASRRWLTSTAVVLGVSLAILASATVVTAVLAARGEPVSFTLPSSLTATVLGVPTGQYALAHGVELSPSATVAVRITEPTGAQSAWGTLLWLPSALLGGAAFALVLLAVLRARRGEVFSGGIVGITRAVGLLLLVGGPLVQLLTGVGTSQLTDSVLPGRADFSPAFTFDGPIVGLCVLALAEVMRHGQRLREELDEVI